MPNNFYYLDGQSGFSEKFKPTYTPIPVDEEFIEEMQYEREMFKFFMSCSDFDDVWDKASNSDDCEYSRDELQELYDDIMYRFL